MSFKIKAAGSAALAALFVSSAALAQTTTPSPVLYGGGATLPVTAYNGSNIYDVTPTARLSAPNGALNAGFTSVTVESTSLFGAYKLSPPARGTTSRPDTSYCGTGSGQGRRTFIGQTGAGTPGSGTGNNFADGICRDYGPTAPAGFSAPVGQRAPHFAATDQPLSAGELSTFTTNYGTTRSAAVQFPTLAGAIAVTFKNNDISPSRVVVFTESQVCQIFSGAISNWSQLGFPSKAIKVVYRTDGSGTSFSFSNHLSAVCPTAVPNAVAGFSTQGTFLAAFPGGAAPAGSLGANGNPGATNAIAANDGAIGYAELSDGLSKNSVGANSVAFATLKKQPDRAAVKGVSPAAKFKEYSPLSLKSPFKLPATGALFEGVVVGPNDGNGRPTLVAATTPVPACLKVVDPNAYATPALNAKGDYAAYPIVAITYLLAYNTGNGADAANIADLVAAPFYGAVKNATSSVGAGTGFGFLAGIPNQRNFIKGCITP